MKHCAIKVYGLIFVKLFAASSKTSIFGISIGGFGITRRYGIHPYVHICI